MLYLDASAGQTRHVTIRTGTSTRWSFGGNNVAETGSQAGTDIQVARYNDAGSYVDSPLTITRAVGIVTSTTQPRVHAYVSAATTSITNSTPPVTYYAVALTAEQSDVGAMLSALLGEVPAKVASLVVDMAAGNPFYVEEVVRHLLESGILGLSDAGYELEREPGPEDLPDSVESVIEARLDRLSADVKRVAQVGAVIGRSFLLDILRHLERDAAREVKPAKLTAWLRELFAMQ